MKKMKEGEEENLQNISSSPNDKGASEQDLKDDQCEESDDDGDVKWHLMIFFFFTWHLMIYFSSSFKNYEFIYLL